MVNSSPTSPQSPIDPAPTGSPQPVAKNPFFPLVTVTVGLFIVTIFSLVATMFGNPQAPAAQFFTRFGGWMLGVEVVAFMIVGLLALMVDRRQSLREWEEYERRQLAKRPHAVEGNSAEPGSASQSPDAPSDTP